jgi:hypothetical protein
MRKEFPIPEPLEIQNTQPKDVEPPVQPKPPATVPLKPPKAA